MPGAPQTTWATGDGATTVFLLTMPLGGTATLWVYVGGTLQHQSDNVSAFDYKVRGQNAGYVGVPDRVQFTVAPAPGATVAFVVLDASLDEDGVGVIGPAAQALVDAARIRHWSFSDKSLGDGAVLLYLNNRLRTHLAAHGAKIEGLVGTVMSYDIQALPSGALVGTVDGVPKLLTTYQDGWPVQFTDDGYPFIDTASPPIARDPFGAHGGTPGFPLPGDMIRLISVVGTWATPPGNITPIDVVPEAQRTSTLPGRFPAVFPSGNRLVPVTYNQQVQLNQRWAQLQTIQISYVAAQDLTRLGQRLNIPSVLGEALIADAANLLAMHEKITRITATEKGNFAAEALRCEGLIDAAAVDILQEPQNARVIYRP